MGRGIPAERSLSEISNGKSREVREAGSNAYTKRIPHLITMLLKETGLRFPNYQELLSRTIS